MYSLRHPCAAVKIASIHLAAVVSICLGVVACSDIEGKLPVWVGGVLQL